MTAAWMQRRRYNPYRQLPQTYSQLRAWLGVRTRVGDIWRDSQGYALTRRSDDCGGVRFSLWRDPGDTRSNRSEDLQLFRRVLEHLEDAGAVP